ncbi:MAG TPA: discoidin domain-containing protein, partial [Thermoanaerobaculia bacterium]|nr:discoidin domain-containing protein [Thermoanaerobaculia bacterium]
GGTVAVVSTYGIGATIHSRRVGLLAAAVGAVGYVDIHFGRIPGYIDPLPWLVLGLYGVARGLRTGRDAAFLAGGMSLGVGCLMYFSGRIAPLVVASWILYLVVFHRRFALARIGGFALVALGALVILGPQLVFFAQHSEVVLGRGGVFVFTAESMEHLKRGYGVDTSAAVLFEQTWRSLLMFNFTRTGAFQAPLPWPAMSGLLAPMLVLGAGWAAGRPRSAGPALVGLWLAVVLVVGSMLTLEAPFWPRLVVLLPAAALLTAFGLDRTAQAAGAALAGERRGGCWIAAGLAALLVVAGAMNWIRYAERMRHWVEPADWLGRLVSAAPAETGFCMVRGPRSFEEEHIRFLAAGRDLVTVPPGEIEEHLLQCVGEARVWVLYEPFHRDLLSTLRARWPGGREERHDEPDGGMGPLFWHPPAEAVAAARPAALLTAWPAESVDAAGSPLAAGRDRALLAAASERVERLALAADGDRRTAWSTAGPQQGGEWLLVELPALAVVTEVRLDSQRLPTAHPRGLTVETSADGRAFAAASAEVVLGPETRAALAAPAVGRWIRLTQTGSDPDHPWSVYEVAVFARFGDGQARFARADLSAARLEGFRVEMAQQLPNAVDGDPRTRWDSGRPQQGGEWLQVELSSEGLVADVWLDTTGSPNDYPRGLSVLHSRDGEIFEPAGIVVRGTTRMHVALDPPVRARWLRIEQTGREEQFYWSVHDLELWGDWSDQ